MIALWNYAKRLTAPLAALLCAGVLAAVVADYPLGPHWLGAALLLVCAVLWRWPHSWLLLVPAALPVLDLAPWTGRFFLDEFDALLAATLLMQAWRGRVRGAGRGALRGAARGWLALFCCSTASRWRSAPGPSPRPA